MVTPSGPLILRVGLACVCTWLENRARVPVGCPKLSWRGGPDLHRRLASPGADTVVVQEVVCRDGDEIAVAEPLVPGANVRRAGEDVALGAVALRHGAVVDAGAIGLACALGRMSLSVVGRPRVGILATGDELREPTKPLAPGEIVGSNSYALAAQVAEAGGVPVSLESRATARRAFASG